MREKVNTSPCRDYFWFAAVLAVLLICAAAKQLPSDDTPETSFSLTTTPDNSAQRQGGSASATGDSH